MGAIGFGPALSVRGMRPAPAFDFVGGVLPPGASFARSSPASLFDTSGQLVTAGPDVPRFGRDPASGAARGLLIEPAAINLCPASDGPLSSYTGNSGVSDDPGTIDGFANAIRFGATPTSSYDYVTRAIAVGAGTSYTLSVIVAMGDGAPPNVDLVHASGDFTLVLDNGFGTELETMPLGGGLYRVAVSRAAPPDPSPTQGIFKYKGQSSRTFRVTGLQLEQGGAATSYIATGAASATRAADMLTLDWGRKGVPDGAMLVRYGFDDGSSQLVETVVAGGVAVVPTDLARPWLRTAARA
jgi:hypothetical protein